MKVHSEELVQAFADPLVVRHPCGHTVPKLGEIRLLSASTYYLVRISDNAQTKFHKFSINSLSIKAPVND